MLYDGGDCVRPRPQHRWPSWPDIRAWPSWPAASRAGRARLEAGRRRDRESPRSSSSLRLMRCRHVRGALRRWRIRASPSSTSGARTSTRAEGGYPCDPRQGHIPGARNVEVSTLFAGPGLPRPPDEIRAAGRSARGRRASSPTATPARARRSRMIALRAAGYDARNYVGSWHEWSRHPDELPIERSSGGNGEAFSRASRKRRRARGRAPASRRAVRPSPSSRSSIDPGDLLRRLRDPASGSTSRVTSG